MVDGYNLYFTGLRPGDDPKHIREAREHVIDVVSRYTAGKQMKAVVFFDGGPAGSHHPRHQMVRGVELRFSDPRCDADSDMKHTLANWHNDEEIHVVTSDNAIASFARRFGAKVTKSQVFAAEVAPAIEAKEDLRAGEPDEKYSGNTPRGELDYWLREFNKGERQ